MGKRISFILTQYLIMYKLQRKSPSYNPGMYSYSLHFCASVYSVYRYFCVPYIRQHNLYNLRFTQYITHAVHSVPGTADSHARATSYRSQKVLSCAQATQLKNPVARHSLASPVNIYGMVALPRYQNIRIRVRVVQSSIIILI